MSCRETKHLRFKKKAGYQGSSSTLNRQLSAFNNAGHALLETGEAGGKTALSDSHMDSLHDSILTSNL